MSPTVESPSRVLFGLFEADLQTGELWKAGKRIKIQSQPFKVLTALLERPGEVVAREDLQLRVWGKDTIVDFDHSLGTAINKIREALSDTADNPRFVETLARRGYRFIAPVTYPPSPQPQLQPVRLPLVPGEITAIQNPPSAQSFPDTPASATPISLPDAHGLAGNRILLNTGALVRWGATVATILSAAAIGFFFGTRNISPKPLHINQITHSGRISPGAPAMESLPATATDGVRIFASVIENGRAALSQISVNGGEIQLLPIPSEIAAPSLGDLSPDGSKLLLRSHLSPESEQALWIVPTGGGSALRLANILAHDATWMPDGKSILYANGNDLFLTHVNDGSQTSYASLPGRAFWLRWSPDGQILRFTILDPISHTLSLWELPAGYHAPHQILANWTNPATECCGTWTSDGTSYVFQSSHDGTSDLWRLKGKSTGNPEKLTNGPLSYEAPVAARNGHGIFFLGVDTHSELKRFLVDKKEFIPERTFLVDASRIDYSRDKKWVAWTDPDGRLWRARIDGTEKLQLTRDSLTVFLAHWSPDGTRLALMAHEPGKAWQIYLITADGGSPEHLLPENRNQADPSWSPDGNSLVFGRVPDLMGKENGARNMQILNLRTRKLEEIPGSEGIFSPRWSPDGRFIAALSLDQSRLFLFNTDSRTWKILAETSVADPVWSSDSRSIFIHAFMDETQPIYRVSVPDGRLESIASLANFRTGDTADYFFSGITPDNTPLVRSRSSTGNLYSLDLDGK
ncbi:winged helix-turn-helix domain-containing protein [Granulicella sp. dw_53]|uniref:winged helix-turn-helix domain-containing protein n=1 Tax=Granulicella sp. dw_53 TaxID=2719792 RepID=UPI001BD3EF7E|nr:winged helix-turn-helix domain-containing protein [Granulicella sp. dw_53]